MITAASTELPVSPDGPELRLLDARPAGLDEPGLKAWARAQTANAPGRHCSRSYRYPYALITWHSEAVGVDIERIEPFDDAFLESIRTPSERRIAPSEGDPDQYVTSLWCGKEALAKALGDALRYDPRRLGSPLLWRNGQSGPWRAAELTLIDRHVGWLCWRSSTQTAPLTGQRAAGSTRLPGLPRWIRLSLYGAILIVIACAVTGCGGGRPTRIRRGEQAGWATPVDYRWLVKTSGRAPTIAAENQSRGTSAWRLTGPAADVGGRARGAVIGYVARQALLPGQTETVYVSAREARKVWIRVYRMGWYHGTGGREMLATGRLPVVAQPRCTHRFATGLTECDWHPTLSFQIPSALPTGVYIAKLSARTGESDCLFVVRSIRPAALLAQIPTATYEAYNAWGGDSLYPGGADRVKLTGATQGIEVSYDRPYDSATGAGQFFARDVAMVRFLERYHYPVSYTTSESIDANPGQVAGRKALLDFGHSEYWSARQRRAFAGALRAGTSLLFFGSDTLAWRVRYARASPAASQASVPDQSMVAYKEFSALDPNRSDPTGVFPDRGARLTGSAYLGCITARLPQPGSPTYRYYAWAPSHRLRPTWLFTHTAITTSTRIPGIIGYELDQRTALTPPHTELVGSGVAPCMPGAQAESGKPTPRGAHPLAETTIYTAPSGAIVFNTGTLGWELALEPVPSASPDAPLAPDPRIVQMTRNLLARVLQRP
ncbi:MAG: 4'-phosphopantetheinyl transferase superfamily protein [Solirubrobacteraceae bacterium]